MNPSHTEYENDLTQIHKNINEWFKANLLTLNLDKHIIYTADGDD
jgi:hypothetical protein